VIDTNFEHSPNAYSLIFNTDDGIKTEVNPLQNQNAYEPMDVNEEGNWIDSSFSQEEKALLLIVFIDADIEIEVILLQPRNALSSTEITDSGISKFPFFDGGQKRSFDFDLS
jgi:hypothetical protein